VKFEKRPDVLFGRIEGQIAHVDRRHPVLSHTWIEKDATPGV
jgi:hypothetical protein